jgi:preprotein translocase SecE subunit
MSFIDYLKDTKAEAQRVSWPTQRQAMVYTAFVVAFSLVIAMLLGLADFIFSKGLGWFIS